MSSAVNAPPVPERRLEQRLKHPRIIAACTPLGRGRANDNVAHALIDVSTSGARLILTEPLNPGDPCLLHLDHAESQRTVTVPAEVRWCVPLASVEGETEWHIAGLRFRSTHGVLALLLKA